jgi:homocitrate synthase NifV
MGHKVFIIDKTIDEALRLGVKFADIFSMEQILRKYPIELIDVTLSHFDNQNVNLDKVPFKDKIRGVISSAPNEIMKAKNLGLTKIVIREIYNLERESMKKLKNALSLVSTFAEDIYLSIENFSCLSKRQVMKYSELIKEFKIKRLILQDSEGILNPFTVVELLNEIMKDFLCPIEFHGNNRFGLATANSLGASKVGIEYIAASVGGIGMPSCTAMEEVLMAAKYLCNKSEIVSGETLAMDCERILSYINIKVPVDKAIIGSYVFAHESGIHVDGIAKNPLLYEVIQPSDVGLERKLIIGKHSGTASIKTKFSEWSMSLTKMELAKMLEKIRTLAESQKRAISDDQLKQIYIDEILRNGFTEVASY